MSDNEEENYFDALKLCVDQSKSSVALSGIPLAILLGQMRLLLQNQSTFVSAVLTIAVLSLFVSTALSWYTSQFARSVLAAETFVRGGLKPAKGRLYFDLIHRISKKPDFPYTEENFVILTEKTVHLTVAFIVIGYASLLVLLLVMIW